ncbi:MAG: hypothetical protein ACSW8I_03010 [bacterium]
MKKILLATAVFTLYTLHLPFIHAQEEQRQYVSWGVFGGPNISAYLMRVDPLLRDTLIADTVIKSMPATGLSFGLFFDYHVTDRWLLQFSGDFAWQQATLRYAGHHSHLLTFGSDVGLSVLYHTPWHGGYLLFSFGPYCHFVLYSAATEDVNLYRRQVLVDPVTGKPRFAMSDIHAGASLSVGYEFANHWFVRLEAKMGTNILNFETPGTYVYPYRGTFGVGCRF